ncbi:MAG: hypothetical protein KA521_00700 [Crocinitomicaceae bacterium]|nr:hypothetical protein [Crocinitomicaceae bacterium]
MGFLNKDWDSDDDESPNSGVNLNTKLAEGVGKLHIPEGYVKNIAAKYFKPDGPKNLTGCLNSILGKKEPAEIINDGQFDAFKNSHIEKLIDKGLNKLSISKEDLIKQPDVIYGPDWREIPDGISFENLEIVKKGNDGKFRYAFFNFAFLFYTEKQLLLFSARFNIALEEITKSSTDEYFYKDVIGVSADEDSFTLKTSGGSALEIEFQKPAYRRYKIDASDAEETVKSLRMILRDVKS